MKRAASFWSLTDRQTPWLHWWQELILNWISCWRTVSTIVVISANGEDQISWDVPSDLDLQRMELEAMLHAKDAER